LAFNIGSGRRYSIHSVAQRMATALGKDSIRPEVTGQYRVGDIRHCFADISQARQVLGYRPQIGLEEGLVDLAGWLEKQRFAAPARVPDARAELVLRGLMVG
jgi:dTDP-L-rhamnose 4-epimerase